MSEDHNNKNEENELPKLSIEEENAFKKMKMSLENNAVFPENFGKMLPPEIQSAFLDGIMKFEKMHRNAKRISIFDKIGSPKIKYSENFSDKEIASELKKLINKLKKNGIGFHVQHDYDNRLIYDFLTNEFLFKQIDDLQMDGMILHFDYEDFYPNHEENLKNLTVSYLEMFLDQDSEIYSENYSKDAKNHIDLNTFRNLFEKFEIADLLATSVDFNFRNTRAKVYFSIDYKAKLIGSGLVLNYKGNGFITFKNKKNRWKLRTVSLPTVESNESNNQ